VETKTRTLEGIHHITAVTADARANLAPIPDGLDDEDVLLRMLG